VLACVWPVRCTALRARRNLIQAIALQALGDVGVVFAAASAPSCCVPRVDRR